MNYPFKKIEKKWQKKWEKQNLYKAKDFSKKPKQYILVEFPYPSGDGLHVGHIRSYTALDVIARKKRMEGYNVLYPMGWDAFGLPTENYAIKTGVHPRKITQKNIRIFKKQLKSIGFSFDWDREINTTDPNYYKWTQWIFLKLFEKGLAYQSKIPINWCPSCKIGLANEEVIEGKCERCGHQTERKEIKQWMLKITKYADRLIEDLKKVDYLDKIKAQQINWIGKSSGVEIKFKIKISSSQKENPEQQNGKYKDEIKVFTTRPDTLFGVTALVIAPEHKIIKNYKAQIINYSEVKNYIKQSAKKTEFERTELTKQKTGVELKGIKAINPANNEEIPIWVGDYVIATYGGGAVMVVPAHDKRDFQFAKKYGLKIREVVSGGNISKEAYVNYGILKNSGRFNGLTSKQAISEITKWLKKKGAGKKITQYKLRDWIFSRQHYWGEPIPIIHCPKCGAVPVPEKDLPVKLPYVKNYQPTKTGESPLANISNWIKVKCPKCGNNARRETDTMPNWAGSNWYFIRYIDPKNDKTLADPKKLKYWLPVDWYNGGMEHTTLHLLYSRFWYKFLFDIGVVPQDEPYKKRTSHGVVLAEDGRKMSKSFGNVINPDDIVKTFGADTLRVYEMFMGPFEQTIMWSMQGVNGVHRFLNRVWKLVSDCLKNKASSKRAIRAIHKLNKKIQEDLETTKFNTAISAFMEFTNFGLENKKEVGKEVIERFLILLAPFAPHISEELWEKLGHKQSIFLEKWPKYNPRLAKEESFELVIQINGKVRDKIESAEISISQAQAEKLALSREKIKKWTKGKKIKKIIFIPKKLINIVI